MSLKCICHLFVVLLIVLCKPLWAGTFYWDTSATLGIQSGPGTWSTTSARWSNVLAGSSPLLAWPATTGNVAVFGSVTTGTAVVSIASANRPKVDSLLFISNGYSIMSDTLVLNGTGVIYVGEGISAKIGSNIKGTAGIYKSGGGMLDFVGAKSYTGSTVVSNGTLNVAGTIDSLSPITVNKKARLTGTGTCKGLVTIADSGYIIPGDTTVPGKLTLKSLVSTKLTHYLFDLGTYSDTLAITGTGAHTIAGKVNVFAGTGLTSSTYAIFKFTGTLSDTAHNLSLGTTPAGFACSLLVAAGSVSVKVVKQEPPASAPKAGFSFTPHTGNAPLTVSFSDTSRGTVSSYAWLFGDGSASAVKSPQHTFINPGKYIVQLTVTGPGGKDSLRHSDTIVATAPPTIITPTILSFTTKPVSATSVNLTWHAAVDTSYHKLKLWFGPTAIDLNAPEKKSLLDSLIVSPSDTSIIVENLEPGTQYYFGLQMFDSNGWLPISSNALATSLLPAEEPSIEQQLNTLKIDTLFFDTASGKIRIAFCIDSASHNSTEDLDVAITYSVDRYVDRDIGKSPLVTLFGPVNCVDTVIKLSEPQRFDTLYYVALWLRYPTGDWIKYTEASSDTVRIGKPYKQEVFLFNPMIREDTVTAFNASVILWKDGDFKEDTSRQVVQNLQNYVTPGSLLPVASPFKFVNPIETPEFFIGFKIRSLPAGRNIRNVHIYTEVGGLFSVVYDTRIDSAHSIVYVKTKNLAPVFIAMIDTMPPRITRISNKLSLPVASTETVRDTIKIDDNIANARYQFYFGRGNEIPQLRESGTLTGISSQIFLTVPDSLRVTSSESGLRSYAIVSDGTFSDTISLSRAVRRLESDAIATDSGVWNPVYATGHLLHKEADSIIARLPYNDSIGYNPKHMRLCRWINYAGNADSSEKWVEFNPKNSDIRNLFTLEPGTIVWLKTRKNLPLDLDSAYTLTPGDTFSVALPPGQWTDFGMPFRFAVPLSEVFAATGDIAKFIDVCRWKQDGASNLFTLEALYIHGMSGQSVGEELEYRAKGGYSFYNHNSEAIILRIPSTLPGMVTKGAAKRSATTSWGVTFNGNLSTGSTLESVYCGYAPDIAKRSYPVGPSFSAVRAMLADRENRALSGYSIGVENRNGFVKELIICNNKDTSQSVTWSLSQTGTFPEGYRESLYDQSTNTTSTSGSIVVPARSTVSRFIIVGDAAFTDQFIKTVHSLEYRLDIPYPNPARSLVNIRYMVPAGSQEQIHVAIYSVSGRLIWENRSKGLLRSGTNYMVWNGRDRQGATAASGVYIVKLNVVNQHGTRINHFEQRLTYLK